MSGRPQRLPASTSVMTSTPGDARPLQVGASRLGTTLRLPAFVATGAALGTAAHAAAADALPDLRLLVPAVAAVALCGLLIRGRERSFETITAALLVSQVAVHLVLGLAPAGGVAAGGHGHEASDTATAVLAHLAPDGPMLVAHLLAAGVAGWWLRRGEAAVWAAVGWVWSGLTVLVAVLHAPTAPASVRWRGRGPEALRDLLVVAGAHRRRGPPLPAAG